ncbi:MAG TPA: tetratricopeptide repeat protein [Anaerolineae bacterium]|nr:tetratricopeptide repeat protein [Anaerolineae bacterium]HQK13953.1 tetratricopeptide repeat protein [Anaerolineae bacterium]
MAGNRLRFDEAIQKANDCVWDERWDEAVRFYRRALAEFPDDVSALMGYAWALLNAEELEEALEVYRRLTLLSPADPGPYERIAEILERTGETARAAEMYYEAGVRYGKQNLTSKMATAYEASLRLRSDNDKTWRALLQHYQAQKQVDKAVLAALWLAYLYQNTHPDWAIEICRQMQGFIPHEPRIGQTMMLLQSQRPVPEPPPISSQEVLLEGIEIEAGDEGTPVDIARQHALAMLAESIFAEDKPQIQGVSQMEVDLLIGKAVDAQTRGDLAAALQAYEQLVKAGVSMPSIHFNLGLLYKEQMRFAEAIEQLSKSLASPEYVLGSHFALGECYQAQGNFTEAAKHFWEAVKIVDLATVQREHADDLIRVYESLAQNLVSTGDPERAQRLSESLVEFLGRQGWEDKAITARKRLDSLARSGIVLSLGELVSLTGSADILRSVALAQEYHRRKKVYNALEELFHTLSQFPDYLPLHYLLASLLQDAGRIEEAVAKFHIVARTYEVRGQTLQALAIYRELLQSSPLDVTVHRHVIELLIQRGQIDEALGQYLQLADAYYQLAQMDRAREVYAEALRLAPRGSQDAQWEVRILHRMADLDLQRLDWLAAIKSNEEILRIAPGDERAHLALYRLYPRTGRPHLGLNALDKLIKLYLEAKNVDRALVVLEDLIHNEPESIPLRARGAQLYLNIGKRDKALEHLDVLGDLQLEAGQKEAAVKTIAAILALDPPNRAAYASLYRELTGQEPPPGRGV